MSERFETRGEIGHSISGVRDQLSVQARVFTVAVGISVIVLGFLYYQYMGLAEKYAELQAAHARVEAQLEAAIAGVDKVKVDTEQSQGRRPGTQEPARGVAEADVAQQRVVPGLAGHQGRRAERGQGADRPVQDARLDLRDQPDRVGDLS